MDLEVIQVRSGTFHLPADRGGTHPWPRRRFVLDRDVWIESSPMSWGLCRAFVEVGGYAATRFWPRERLPAERVHVRLGRLTDLHWRTERLPQESRPARGIGWADAWAMAAWSDSRLPLEAELKLFHERGGDFVAFEAHPEWTADTYSSLHLAGTDGRGLAWNPGVLPAAMAVRSFVATPRGGRSSRLSAAVDGPREACVARRLWETEPTRARVIAVISPDEPLNRRSS